MEAPRQRPAPSTPPATPSPEEADLGALEATIAGLAERPVDEHPDALEQVHRDLVTALDDLAGSHRAAPAGEGE